jgi:UDP-N-acetylglucosamine acyltransferase
MTSAHMGHNSKLHDNVILANNVILAGHVTVEERAFLGGTIVIHQFCRIGKMVIMSGFSGSRQDIPPYAKTDGRPAKIAGINTIGLKRSGVSTEDRELIKHAYKLLFHSGYNTSQALEHIAQEIPSDNEYVGHLVDFVKSSKRGIIK